MSGPIANAIRRIEDHIGDERYWTKFNRRLWIDTNLYAHCLIGAVEEVVRGTTLSGDWRGYEAFRVLIDQLAIDFSADEYGCGFSACSFNDKDATTHADVMLFLSAALDVAEAEGW